MNWNVLRHVIVIVEEGGFFKAGGDRIIWFRVGQMVCHFAGKEEMCVIYIETGSNEGAVNLAFEEYFLNHPVFEETVLMLWRNRPTVVVGAFQNTLTELDLDYVQTHGIDVVRRQSGGGAVYHDFGNLCFSFITRQDSFENLDYSQFLRPVVAALRSMGVAAEQSGRNDLTCDGAKISGSAVRAVKGRVLFHGTLLYDSDLSVLSRVLVVQNDKLEAKGIKSVRARVTNIRTCLENAPDVLGFRARLLAQFFAGGAVQEYYPTDADRAEIERLATRYRAQEWVFGKNPPADFVYGLRFPGGKVTVRLSFAGDRIAACRFEGDFLGCVGDGEAERALVGIRYTESEVSKALDSVDIGRCFGNISKQELMACLMGRE